ncbi:hypothetical protein ERN12_14150 [Rhodobacteraceae bacterium]|nr:hypothetical protein ERN12_14150 [Paracoccaceae bacterium]
MILFSSILGLLVAGASVGLVGQNHSDEDAFGEDTAADHPAPAQPDPDYGDLLDSARPDTDTDHSSGDVSVVDGMHDAAPRDDSPQTTDHADIAWGTQGEDALDGLQGDDQINGYGGDDMLWGDAGDDWLFGGAGDDTLWGEDGDDTLFGDAGDDILHGGSGADQLTGGLGEDRLAGGEGRDHLSGGTGADMLWGGADDDMLEGGLGADILTGGAGADDLSGGDGDDVLIADSAPDALSDTAALPTDAPDMLNGGEGDDRLYAGQGDWMTGGDGADLFALGGATAGGDASDAPELTTITDFEQNLDRIAIICDPQSAEPPEMSIKYDGQDSYVFAGAHCVAKVLSSPVALSDLNVMSPAQFARI